MSPRVSIVIPAYNNANYLSETISSVLAQTFDDYELIVADHSSVDNTAKVLDTFRNDRHVQILAPTPTGGGAQRNWNRVSQAASGELIKLVCGDDLLDPGLVAAQVRAFDEHPSIVLSACRRRLVDANGKVVIASRGLPKWMFGLIPGNVAIRETVRSGANIFGEPGCIMMRRACLEEEGWWDSTNPYLIDERTYCRVLQHGDLFGVGETMASFRISASQWSVRLANSQSQQAVTFHKDLRATHPEYVNEWDVRRGNLLARLTAYGRRLVYLGLGARRMGAAGRQS